MWNSPGLPESPCFLFAARQPNSLSPMLHFAAVVASDVLEHVPPQHRLTVVKEALRVTRKVAIFGFPAGSTRI